MTVETLPGAPSVAPKGAPTNSLMRVIGVDHTRQEISHPHTSKARGAQLIVKPRQCSCLPYLTLEVWEVGEGGLRSPAQQQGSIVSSEGDCSSGWKERV